MGRGAKTAMAVALQKPEIVSSVISVDNAPVDAALSRAFGEYMRVMKEIERAHLTKQSQADEYFQKVEPSLPVRQFLLTNLTRRPGDPLLHFRIPLEILSKALDDMAGFPFHPDNQRFEKPALFIRGIQSHYVTDDMLPVIGQFFPRFSVVDVEAGHWVISENPEGFRKAVVDFLSSGD